MRNEYQISRIKYYEEHFRGLSEEEFLENIDRAIITVYVVSESHLWLAALISIGKERYGEEFDIKGGRLVIWPDKKE